MREPAKPRAEDGYRLSEAAARARITPAQLEYYVMCGLVEPTGRSAGGHRLFDDEALRRIRVVRLLNASGYPLREIRETFAARLVSR